MTSNTTLSRRVVCKGWLFNNSVRTATKRSAPGETACWTLSVSSGSGKSFALSKSGCAGQSIVPGGHRRTAPTERMIGCLRRSTTVSPPRSSGTFDWLETFTTPPEGRLTRQVLGKARTRGGRVMASQNTKPPQISDLFVYLLRTAMERSAPREAEWWTLSGSLGSGKKLALLESGGTVRGDGPGNVGAQLPDQHMIDRNRQRSTRHRRGWEQCEQGVIQP